MDQPTLESLTPREREILALIAEGSSLPDIAQKLHRSLKTIESHRLSIGRKLNASNRVELARIAIAQGLVSIKPAFHAGPHDGRGQSPERELRWLADINEAVCNVTGQRYIEELCKAFTRVLGVRFCAVCISEPTTALNDRYMVALSEHGRSRPSFHYDVRYTPVPHVIDHAVCRIDEGLAEQYPQDPFIKEHGLDSYLGIRLQGDFGGSTGVLAVLHDRPMQHTETIDRIMRFFLARTSGELERVHRADELALLRQELEDEDVEHEARRPARPADGFDSLNPLLTHCTGVRLLNDLVDALCDLFDARFCGVCVMDTLRSEPTYLTLAFSEKGYRLDPIHYPIANTPCEKAMMNGFFCAPRDVVEQFPQDHWLRAHGILSYFGIRLEGSDGDPIGVMWLVDDKPTDNAHRVETTLRYLASRVSAEAEALKQLEQLRETNEQLEAKLAERSGH